MLAVEKIPSAKRFQSNYYSLCCKDIKVWGDCCFLLKNRPLISMFWLLKYFISTLHYLVRHWFLYNCCIPHIVPFEFFLFLFHSGTRYGKIPCISNQFVLLCWILFAFALKMQQCSLFAWRWRWRNRRCWWKIEDRWPSY